MVPIHFTYGWVLGKQEVRKKWKSAWCKMTFWQIGKVERAAAENCPSLLDSDPKKSDPNFDWSHIRNFFNFSEKNVYLEIRKKYVELWAIASVKAKKHKIQCFFLIILSHSKEKCQKNERKMPVLLFQKLDFLQFERGFPSQKFLQIESMYLLLYRSFRYM